MIVGDFNIHVDNKGDNDAVRFLQLLDMHNLIQHVNEPTHTSGHTQDLIITRSDSTLVSCVQTGSLLSDHWSVKCDLSTERPKPEKKIITYRKLKNIDKNIFKEDITAEISQYDLNNLSQEDICHWIYTTTFFLQFLTNMHQKRPNKL